MAKVNAISPAVLPAPIDILISDFKVFLLGNTCDILMILSGYVFLKIMWLSAEFECIDHGLKSLKLLCTMFSVVIFFPYTKHICLY